jgi:putative transferase (TIGR04331 family)
MVDVVDQTPRHLFLESVNEPPKDHSSYLLLGEWCRPYEQWEAWDSCFDLALASPVVFEDLADKEKAFSKLEEHIDELLGVISDALNETLNVRETKEYWQNIMGHWLIQYVTVMSNRYLTIEKAIKNFHIKSASTLSVPENYFARNSFADFLRCSPISQWNHALFSLILRDFKHRKLVDFEEREEVCHSIEDDPWSGGQKWTLEKLYRKVSDLFNRCDWRHSRAPFILETYLPRALEYELKLKEGVCPLPWCLPEDFNCELDMSMRKTFQDCVNDKFLNRGRVTEDERLSFLLRHVSDFIPALNLEGHLRLRQKVSLGPWPKEPRYIFTSSCFAMSEYFKVYAAECQKRGSSYMVGQHGNNYGTHRAFGRPHVPERAASNAFITWGWSDGSNARPAFNLKLAKSLPQSAPKSQNSKGGVLLFELDPPNRNTLSDGVFEYERYLKQQYAFVGALDTSIQTQIQVRLHTSPLVDSWSIKKRWRKKFSELDLNGSSVPLNIARGQHCLMVHSYDSTGILETLALNIPTIAFWDGGMDHLLPEAHDVFQSLVDAKIIFFDPVDAAHHINEIWNDIEYWWESGPAQSAVARFCERYSRLSDDPVLELRNLLKEVVLEK